jgi:acyl carrier protein
MSTESKVKKIIAELTGLNLEEVKLDSTPNKLAMDSLDTIESVMAIEDEFCIEINDDDINEHMTVQDMINLVDAAL